MRPRIHWMLVLLAALLFACPGPNTPSPPAPPSPPSPPAPPSPPSPTSPSSFDLIDQALSTGQIDEETALTYKVFATFGDARLPAAYRGATSPLTHSSALEEAAARFDSLSDATQQTLAPFFTPPAYQGSWANPTPTGGLRGQANLRCTASLDADWTFAERSSGHVRVWYDKTKTSLVYAGAALDALENDIWPKLIGTLGLEKPLPDNDFICDGGNDRLDVYLVDMSVRGTNAINLGETQDGSYVKEACKHSSVYIMASDSASVSDLEAILAHEFTHAIQWAYESAACHAAYGWFNDATANWAIEYVYHAKNFEHSPYATWFFETPEKSLDDRTRKDGKIGRDYGAYVFFQFLEQTLTAATIKSVFDATKTKATSLEAVDSSIPGGLDKQWPEFAKTLWNQAPIDAKPASFKSWDGLTETPALAKELPNKTSMDLNGKPEDKTEFETQVLNVSAKYYHFSFSDPATRSVLFHNTFFENRQRGEKVHVQALWKPEGGQPWVEEDWTDDEWVGFCRDLKNQRLEELVVIVSSAEWRYNTYPVTAATVPSLKRNNLGCYKFKGTTTLIEKHSSWSGLGRHAESNFVFEIDPSATAVNAKHPQIPNSLRVGLAIVMQLTGTDYTFEESYSTTGCSFSLGAVSFPLSRTPPRGFMFTNPFPELPITEPTLQKWFAQPSRAYTGAVSDLQMVTVSVSGTGCSPTAMDVTGGLLLTNDAKNGVVLNPPVAKPDGTLKGNFKTSDASFDWTLSPQSEP